MAELTQQNKWAPLAATDADREKIWAKSRSFAGDVWYRFRHKPTAIAGFVIILVLALFALVGPMLTPYDYAMQNLELVNIPPLMKVYVGPSGEYLYITQNLRVLSVNPDGTLGHQLTRVREEDDKSMTIYESNGQEVALYYGGSPYVIADEATGNIYSTKMVWNGSYLLGTDALGRDILARLMYGTRVSLVVAFVAALVNMVIGILYGGIAGYAGGAVDAVMMRIVDIISTIPLTLYVILIMQLLGNGIQSIIIALGTVYWVDMARVVRGQVLSLKQQEFVQALRAFGISDLKIAFKHLLPNTLGPVVVNITLSTAMFILQEAALSVLGYGVPMEIATWGNIINVITNGGTIRFDWLQYWWMWLPCSIMLILFVLAINFVGDGLRDASDPTQIG